jgi:hypothetical protein
MPQPTYGFQEREEKDGLQAARAGAVSLGHSQIQNRPPFQAKKNPPG